MCSALLSASLVTDGFDYGAIEFVRGLLHHVQANRDGFTRFRVTKLIVQLRAAHDIGEQNGDFQILYHKT
jgi:hypothetical protein